MAMWKLFVPANIASTTYGCLLSIQPHCTEVIELGRHLAWHLGSATTGLQVGSSRLPRRHRGPEVGKVDSLLPQCSVAGPQPVLFHVL